MPSTTSQPQAERCVERTIATPPNRVSGKNADDSGGPSNGTTPTPASLRQPCRNGKTLLGDWDASDGVEDETEERRRPDHHDQTSSRKFCSVTSVAHASLATPDTLHDAP